MLFTDLMAIVYNDGDPATGYYYAAQLRALQSEDITNNHRK